MRAPAILGAAMPFRVLIVDNAVHRFLFKPAQHWKAALRDVPVDVVNAPSGSALPELAGYSHVLLTGSEASVLRPAPWLQRECELVRDAEARGIPLLGSCFGLQVLVYAISSPAAIRRSPTPEVGWISVDIVESDELLAGVPRPWHVFTFHLDEVADAPPPWRVLARSERCAAHALRYGDQRIWGIQGHPEISGRAVGFLARRYLSARGSRSGGVIGGHRRHAAREATVDAIARSFLAAGEPSRGTAGTAGTRSSPSIRS